MGIKEFRIDGVTHGYLVHPYNTTWRNERSVELPIAFDWLSRQKPGRTLEVGHVLGHYRRLGNHTVVDKYEPSPGIINIDVLQFQSEDRFRSIVAISTLEHVGYDEEERSSDKTRRVVNHLVGLLEPDGELLITFPLGYNRDLDDHLLTGALEFDTVTVMKRTSALGAWEQTSLDHVPDARYGFPFRNGNAIAVCTRRAPLDPASRLDGSEAELMRP